MTHAGALSSVLHEGVLTLTLSRPDKRNALSAALVEELHQALDRADLDPEVRAVALRGAGQDFCAGADLDELLASADCSPAENEASALRLGRVLLRIRQLPKPVVAVVQGRALAGGAGLATACDVVLAGAGAQLGYPEIRRGFVPAMVMAFLKRAVGEKLACDLVLTGRLLTAADALQAGLVSRVVPDQELETAAAGLLADLAGTSGSAMALTKQLWYQLEGRSVEDGVLLGARVNAVARQTPDFRSAIARFLGR